MTGDLDGYRELEERVTALESRLEAIEAACRTATNRDLPLLKGSVRALADADIESIEELPEIGRQFKKEVTELSERLESVEGQLATLSEINGEASTKEAKVAAIHRFAANKRNGRSKVSLSPHEVKGCTGVSQRYAYELIDVMGEEIDGIGVREPKQVNSGSGAKRKQKALLVDFEQVHTRNGVNEFTTGNKSEQEMK